MATRPATISVFCRSNNTLTRIRNAKVRASSSINESIHYQTSIFPSSSHTNSFRSAFSSTLSGTRPHLQPFRSSNNTSTNNHTKDDADQLHKILKIPPGGLDGQTIHIAVDMVAQYAFGYEGRKVNADLALQLLERLLQEEFSSQRQNRPIKQIVKRGMVFNVLKACAKHPTKPESLFRLESLHIMIGERGSSSPHLWHANLSSYFIAALVKCKHRDAPKFAEGLLMDMEELFRIHPDQLHPEGSLYASVILAFSVQRKDVDAERLLHVLMDKFGSRHVSSGLTARLCNQVLNAIAFGSPGPGSPANRKISGGSQPSSSLLSKSQRGQKIVDRMEDLNAKGNYHWIKPDVISYTSLIQCYCNDGKVKEGEHLIRQMFEMYHARYLNRCPDPRTFNIVLNAMAKQSKKEKDTPQRVLALLTKMEDMIARDPHTELSVLPYNSAINALGKFGMVSEAEDIVHHMHRLRDSGQLQDGPNHITYSCLLYALSRSDQSGLAERAQGWYEKMVDLYTSGEYPNMKPDSPMFTNLIRTFANEGLGLEAEEALKTMNRLYEQGDLETRPTQAVYSCTIDALARSGEANAPERAEALVKEMKHNSRNPMKPNEYTLTALLNCYASLGLSRKAVRLLQEMHEMQKNGDFANGGGPSVFSYGCVLNALSRSRDVDAPELAKQLVDQMWTHCDEDGNEALRPNHIVYNSLLHCYAYHGRGTEAETLLREMEELSKAGRLKNGRGPCIVSYLTTLNAHAKSKDADAPERARALFDSMDSNPKVERTYGAFHSLLLCYSAHGRVKEADHLLREMIDLYICGDLEDRPNTTSFNTLMDSLSRSSISDKTDIALDILKTMIELRDSGYKDVEPDGVTVNIFLRCFGSKGQYKEGKKYIEELTGLVRSR